MGASYEINRERCFLSIRLADKVDSGELHSLMDRVIADPSLGPVQGVIADLSEETRVGAIDRALAALPRLILMMGHLQTSHLAAISTRPAQIGVLNLLSVHARQKGVLINQVRSRRDAEIWLEQRSGQPLGPNRGRHRSRVCVETARKNGGDPKP